MEDFEMDETSMDETEAPSSALVDSDGCIVRIELNNFLTYERCVCTPGPNLNVIIGANGTGKSSIICGICLAVGGSPKVLGRSETMSDYIRNGAEKGFVSLIIKDSTNGDREIKLALERHHSPVYTVNGRRATQAEVRALVASYNIQVDNPCTFLAQDKVKSFSEQNPKDLLLNMERASSQELLEKHEALGKRREEVKALLLEKERLDARLRNVEGEMQGVRQRAEHFLRRRDLHSRIDVLEKKLAILNWDESQEKIAGQKKQVEDLEGRLADERGSLGRRQSELDDATRNVSICREEIQRAQAALRRLGDRQTIDVDSHFYKTKVVHFENAYKRVLEEARDYKKNLKEAKETEKRLKEQLERAKREFEDEYENKIYEIEEEKSKLDMEDREMRREQKEIEEEIQNVKGDEMKLKRERLEREARMESRLRLMATRFQHSRAADAWRWYIEHKDRFEGPVYVPMLSMWTRSARDTLVLDNAIKAVNLPLFIFSSKKDEQLLTNSKHPWHIASTVVTPEQINRDVLDARLPDHLAPHGFRCLASELLEAPPAVKHFLCQTDYLHLIPIGDASTEKKYAEICKKLKNTQFKRFFTSTSKVVTSVSRYSNEILISKTPFRDKTRYLNESIERKDKEEEDYKQLEASLQERRSSLTAKKMSWQTRMRCLNDRHVRNKDLHGDWKRKKGAISMMTEELLNRHNAVERLEENRPDEEQAKAALDENKAKALREAFQLVSRTVLLLKKRNKAIVDITLRVALHGNLMKTVRDKKRTVEQQKDNVSECQELLDEAKRVLEGAESLIERARAELRRKCALSTTDRKQLTATEKKALEGIRALFRTENIPLDKESVVDLLTTERARLAAASTSTEGSEQDVERLAAMERNREEMRERLVRMSEEVTGWEERLRTKVNEWLDTLREHISTIDEHFSAFFRALHCTGEVQLETPNDELDVDGYGLLILVRFRDEERLRRLDHRVQSGGERSVATMLFLLALQQLTPVPFRCVDEINQGMDPTNERRVFALLVNILSSGNLSRTQYFLLTPKLLSDLSFGEKATVHVVHNGTTEESERNLGTLIDRICGTH